MRSASSSPDPSRRDEPRTAAAITAMELLGQRWNLRIVWELEAGDMGFLELRRRMDNCSSSMLSERLRQLQSAKLVEKNSAGAWELTHAGNNLSRSLERLWEWAEVWVSGASFHPMPPEQ